MVSVIVYFISFFVTGTAKLASSVTAYSTIATAILMILGYALYSVSKFAEFNTLSSWQYFTLVLSNSGPFILLLGIIAYSLYLLIHYQKRITVNHVTVEYNTFSSISVILMLVEIYLFYSGTNSKIFMSTGRLPKLGCSIMYLVGVLNLSCVLIMGTILKYYVTDG
jgi:hypothetical protein